MSKKTEPRRWLLIGCRVNADGEEFAILDGPEFNTTEKFWLVHQSDYESALAEKDAELVRLEDDARTYKREWESAIERERYRNEQLTEANEKLAALSAELQALKEKYGKK